MRLRRELWGVSFTLLHLGFWLAAGAATALVVALADARPGRRTGAGAG